MGFSSVSRLPGCHTTPLWEDMDGNRDLSFWNPNAAPATQCRDCVFQWFWLPSRDPPSKGRVRWAVRGSWCVCAWAMVTTGPQLSRLYSSFPIARMCICGSKTTAPVLRIIVILFFNVTLLPLLLQESASNTGRLEVGWALGRWGEISRLCVFVFCFLPGSEGLNHPSVFSLYSEVSAPNAGFSRIICW